MRQLLGLLTGYLKSLKPLDVEEPIDVWVHRPLAYLLAWALYPTPVSPIFVTCCSILLGTAAGAWMLLRPPNELYIAGLLALILGGAGPLSIDALRSRRRQRIRE